MVTIVLTNRNRDLQLVKRCLDSLVNQTNKDFKIELVDYGSRENNLKELKGLIDKYSAINLISCNNANELWCKSRAINIVLKQCETSHFFVGDIDMMYHPECINKLYELKSKADAVYFQVGFLSEAESKNNKSYKDYNINFKSTNEATGITLYNTKVLKSINGYDEFYHGWGSEDTDVHVRLKNLNKSVLFYDESILMLHQWHPKTYRSKDSLEPFHSNLEKINQEYLIYTAKNNKTVANTKFDWGYFDAESYNSLHNIEVEFEVTNELSDFKGFLNNILLNTTDKVISVSINEHEEYKKIKDVVKKILNKKVRTYISMQDINDCLLETIITNCKNAPYKYTFDSLSQRISLIIKL
ncbi:galactosyltransferase-related protein [uncultured Algibacter sp.]|uniref:glycosyltransferase family 2 protein n=1 Tax=uncultured Algibacter sp. TaxID=298659 RepID=UPI002616837E|nr:galactosyltransferase-related protein [uncultured Algibacter sp.]